MSKIFVMKEKYTVANFDKRFKKSGRVFQSTASFFCRFFNLLFRMTLRKLATDENSLFGQ